MTGPHRTYGSNETTSIIRPQPSESLTIGKLAPVADADATHAGEDASYEGIQVVGQRAYRRGKGAVRFPSGKCAAGRGRLHPLSLYTIIAVEHDRSDLQRGVISIPP